MRLLVNSQSLQSPSLLHIQPECGESSDSVTHIFNIYYCQTDVSTNMNIGNENQPRIGINFD